MSKVEIHPSNIQVDSQEDDRSLFPIFPKVIRPCLGEMIGVMFFVFIGCNAAIMSGTLLGAALAHGLTIALLISGIGNISGGHFNPAVTLGVALAGGISPVLALGYTVSQLIGGVLGAAYTRGMLNESIYRKSAASFQDISRDITPGQAIFCEMMLTSLLVLTVLVAAVDNKTKSPLAPFAIGMAVTVDILAGGAVSGASMNPARSFGPAIVYSYYGDPWKHHYVYWVGPLLGSIFAAIQYRLFLASTDKRLIKLIN